MSPGFISWHDRGAGLPRVTPSHGKDQWPSAPAAASPSSCLNFLLNSWVCLVKNANPANLFSYNHTGDESLICPQPCKTNWVTVKGLNTFLHPSSSQLVGTCPNIAMLFQTSYLVSSKPVSVQWSAYPLTWNGIFFCLGVAVLDLSCVWHCEIGVRISVGKLDKEFGCIIACHAIPCYTRDASSVTASWPVHTGTIEATTRKVWNQRNWMDVTRDYRINKKAVFHKTLATMSLVWFPPDWHLSDNTVLPRMWV